MNDPYPTERYRTFHDFQAWRTALNEAYGRELQDDEFVHEGDHWFYTPEPLPEDGSKDYVAAFFEVMSTGFIRQSQS